MPRSSSSKVAVERINADGGVNGEQLVLQIEDDACDPNLAVAVANKLAMNERVSRAGDFPPPPAGCR